MGYFCESHGIMKYSTALDDLFNDALLAVAF